MPDIKTGEGAPDMTGVSEEMYDLFPFIDYVWGKYGCDTPVITEGVREPDPKKTKQSFHVYGKALDIRANDVPDEDQDELAHDLQVSVGPLYQVVSEHFDNADWNHIHIEAQAAVTNNRAVIWYESPKAKERSRR